MSLAARLADSIKIRARFVRSVHLSRDFSGAAESNGYVPSALAFDLAKRMYQGAKLGTSRCWSLVGPYGTGKSSFALYLASALSGNCSNGSAAYNLRLGLGLTSDFVPVLVVGERSSLRRSLLSALASELRRNNLGGALLAAIEKGLAGEMPPPEAVAQIFDRAAELLSKDRQKGLLIIIDEMGKFLEFAAAHPEQEDTHVLQTLAEAAARAPSPYLLITVLHSSLVDYLPAADHVRRQEWAKVHGRFMQVTFQEPPEQMLLLLVKALHRELPSEWQRQYRRKIARWLDDRTIFGSISMRGGWQDLVENCWPFNPVVSLLLGPIFRSELAQHERSLFSFLTSFEPAGFEEFLLQSTLDGELPWYNLDRFHEYLMSSIGHALFRSGMGRRWAEIQQAVDQVASTEPLAGKVIRVIGLLGLAGRPVGLRANAETIALAVGAEQQAVRTVLDKLVHRSLVVHRRHIGGYALWEGSDIDLEALYQEAKGIARGGDVSKLLGRSLELSPLIARAHYIERGTLRAFPVTLVAGNEEAMAVQRRAGKEHRDGEVIFVIGAPGADTAKLISVAQQLDREAETAVPTLWSFPSPISGLADAAVEVEAWQYVCDQTPSLAGDRAARSEAAARLEHARAELERLAGSVFGVRGQRFRPELSVWFCQGKQVRLESPEQLQRWLSDLCSSVFSEAPLLHNELINRDILSAAASKARKLLLHAMLVGPPERRLGMSGTPAEVSIYESVLRSTKIHRQEQDGVFRFGPPQEPSWIPAWQAVERFLEETLSGRRPVAELFARLSRPPIGMRESPMVILLLAVLLTHGDRVGLYTATDGVFVPELREEVLERLARNPGEFEIQLYDHATTKKLLLNITAALEEGGLEVGNERGLLQVVKALVLFAHRLPAHARLTRRISPEASALRDVLARTKDPDNLLRVELGMALGLSSMDEPGRLRSKLASAIRELRMAYPALLDRIEQSVRSVFGSHGSTGEVLGSLRKRTSTILPYCAAPDLLVMLRELAREVSGEDWRERLGRAVLSGNPANRWTDREEAEFSARLVRLHASFVSLEELAAWRGRAPEGTIVRVGLLDGKLNERRTLVNVPAELSGQVDALYRELSWTIGRRGGSDAEARTIRIAALARALEAELGQEKES